MKDSSAELDAFRSVNSAFAGKNGAGQTVEFEEVEDKKKKKFIPNEKIKRRIF